MAQEYPHMLYQGGDSANPYRIVADKAEEAVAAKEGFIRYGAKAKSKKEEEAEAAAKAKADTAAAKQAADDEAKAKAEAAKADSGK